MRTGDLVKYTYTGETVTLVGPDTGYYTLVQDNDGKVFNVNSEELEEISDTAVNTRNGEKLTIVDDTTCPHNTKVQDKLGNVFNVDRKNLKHDNVNSPSHYSLNRKGIECIEAIEAALTPEEYRGMLAGTCLKYIWRRELKGNPLEDVRKARWYLDRLIAEYEKE